jgi:hypothetical protein
MLLLEGVAAGGNIFFAQPTPGDVLGILPLLFAQFLNVFLLRFDDELHFYSPGVGL